MEEHQFQFKGKISGEERTLSFSVPFDFQTNSVVTNRFCPQSLLCGGIPYITAINGESKDEFIRDCQMQLTAMTASSVNDSRSDAHICGLMAAVMAHLNRCGRLIFGDLLIYMDCFSYLLWADGASEEEVKRTYPHLVKTIVDLYPGYVKSTVNLALLKDTAMYHILEGLTKNTE